SDVCSSDLEVLVVAHQSTEVIAERDDAGPGQSRDVDDCGRLEATAVGNGVAENQASFGVGIENFHRLTGHGRDDVRRLDGAAAWHVLAGCDDDDEINGQSKFGNR